MELRQLRAVLAIVETRSVTKAAESLHVVQPAISRQVRLLEAELGKAVFVRTRDGMELTPEGVLLVQHARRAIAALDQASAAINPDNDAASGIVTVGFLPTVCDLLADDLVSTVRRAFPQIRLRLSAGYTDQLQEWLDEGVIDIGILSDRKSLDGLDTRPLLDEPFSLVGSRDAGFEWDGPQPFSVLANLPLILPSSTHSVRGIVEHVCTMHEIPLNIVAETDDLFLTRTLVMSGTGYSVSAGVGFAEGLRANKLVAVPLGFPPLQRRVVLTLSSGRRTSTAVQQVASILYERVQEFVSNGRWLGARSISF